MKRILVTGGAGFIGSNLCAELARRGHQLRVLDNLSRKGVRNNAEWLKRLAPDQIEIVVDDVRDPGVVRSAAEGMHIIFHLAGQVAVTTSVTEPRMDFEVNALGTLNALEAARLSAERPTVFYTSTNKVYGGMEDLGIALRDDRYGYADLPDGVNESRPLDFHSPYGCSKGAGDQYVRDYARIYDFPTVVFRMSCIYGIRQMGNEDQGWLAHFARAMLQGHPLNLFGDGKQIRDVLFIDDLVRAFCLALDRIDTTRGQVYNIGGGPKNTLSLLELIAELQRLTGANVPVHYHDWRPGDQRVYVSDSRKAMHDFGWQPTIGPMDGIRKLVDWLHSDDANMVAL